VEGRPGGSWRWGLGRSSYVRRALGELQQQRHFMLQLNK